MNGGDQPFTISTGSLPSGRAVAAALTSAHRRFGGTSEGEVSQVYPALGRADREHFGLALVGTNGATHEVGHSRVPFTLMSVAKPFVFAIACEYLGVEQVCDLAGIDATGLPFNSAQAIERSPNGRTNPMVNAGAIATTSLMPGTSVEERWEAILIHLSRFAGRELELDEEVWRSAQETNFQNRGLAMLLAGVDAIEGDPLDATELYTRQSCVSVTAHDVATMGATLANGGVNPATGRRVVGAEAVRAALAVMTIAGLYEGSGSWLLEVGLPGKSGISGGMVTVSPGKGSLGSYAPPLDASGNSVRGRMAARSVSRRLGLDILASSPAHPAVTETLDPGYPRVGEGNTDTA